MRMYLVQTKFLYNHCADELTKFIKITEKINRCSFDPTISIYKILSQNCTNKRAIKR
jgi:hypothetical protein